MKPVILILAFLVLTISCTIEPGKINYGKDACHYCTMTIVDHQHAAQIVTDKGKVFKYDAIECMLNDLKDRQAVEISMYLVIDYNNPGEFVNATDASYLISKEIPSPMGAFLSAFSTPEEAEKLRSEKGGDVYNWQSIQTKFK